jgi:hypothetical protein
VTTLAALLRAQAAAEQAAGQAKVAELLRQAELHEAGHREWTDQAGSPLGRRRHILAVRARVAQGDSGAAIVGRRALLAPAALTEELARVSAPRSRKPRSNAVAAQVTSMADRLTAAQRGAR